MQRSPHVTQDTGKLSYWSNQTVCIRLYSENIFIQKIASFFYPPDKYQSLPTSSELYSEYDVISGAYIVGYSFDFLQFVGNKVKNSMS